MSDRIAAILARGMASSKASMVPNVRSLVAPRLSAAPPPIARQSSGANIRASYSDRLPAPPVLTLPTTGIFGDTSGLASSFAASAAQLPQKSRKQEDTPWGVYDVPGVGPVAMPTDIGDLNDYRQMGDAITDPDQIQRAKDSNFAYDKLSDEDKKLIRLPDQPTGIGATIAKATGQVADTAAQGAAAALLQKNASKLMADAMRTGTAAAGKGISTAIAGQATRKQEDETAFALVTNNQTGTNELVPKSILDAAPDGTFTVITPNVNADEAQRISDLGLVSKAPDAPVTMMGPEDGRMFPNLERDLVQARDDLAARRREVNARGVVKVEDDVAVPPGVTPDGGYRARIGMDDQGTGLPKPPPGYVWVVDVGGQGLQPGEHPARLVPAKVKDGVAVSPEPGQIVVGVPDGVSMPEDTSWLNTLATDPAQAIRDAETALGSVGPTVDEVGDAIDTAIRKIPGADSLLDAIDDTSMTDATKAVVDAIRSTPLDEGADWVWNTNIVGTDTSIGDVASAIWNADVPGLNASIGDLATGFVEYLGKGQHSVITAYVDNQYEKASGNQVEGEGGVWGVIGDNPVSQTITKLAVPFTGWVDANPDLMQSLYEDGYDANGDGTPDIFGADAVYQYWEDNEANVVEVLLVQLVTDPLTWAPVVGQVGTATRLIGRGIRMAPEAGSIARTVGRTGELVGDAIYRGSRGAEIVGDLGLEYVLKGVKAGVDATGLTRATSDARRTGDLSDIGKAVSETTSTTRRQDRTIIYGPDGKVIGSDLDTPPNLEIVETPTPDAGDVARQTEDGRVVVADEEATGTPGTRIVEEPDGERVVVETTTPNGEVSTSPPMSEDAAWRTVNDSAYESGNGDIPPRWLPRRGGGRTIDKISNPLYNDLAARMSGEWQESVDIARGLGSGTPGVGHAIESSRIARRTLQSLQDIADEAGIRIDLPEWELNTTHYQNAGYAATEHVIRLDWDETGLVRDFLAGEKGVRRLDGTVATPRYPIASPAPLGNTPSRQALTAANNYVDIVAQHAQWHPRAFDNPDFMRAWQQAVDLDADLRARGKRVSPGGIETPPLSEIPLPDGSLVSPTEGVVKTEPRVTNAPGEDVAPAQAVDGQPDIMERYESAPGYEPKTREYYLSDDGPFPMIVTEPTSYTDVPQEWRDAFPNAKKRSWWSAQLEAYPEGQPKVAEVAYAPTERQALGLMADEARERGLIPNDPPRRNGQGPLGRITGQAEEATPVAPEPAAVSATPAALPEPASGREWVETGSTPGGRPIQIERDINDTTGLAGFFDSTREMVDGRLRVVSINTPQENGWRLLDGDKVVARVERGGMDVDANHVPIFPNKQRIYEEADRYLDSLNTTPAPAAPTPQTRTAAKAQRTRQRKERVKEFVESERGTTPVEETTDPEVVRQQEAQQRQQEAEQRQVRIEGATRAVYGDVEPAAGTTLDEMNPSTTSVEPVEVTPDTPTTSDPTGTAQIPERAPVDIDPEITLDEPEISPAAQRVLDNPPANRPLGTGKGGGPDDVQIKVTSRNAYAARSGFAVDSDGTMYWLQRPISEERVKVLTEHKFTDGKFGKKGETFMDRVSYRVQKLGDADGWKNFPDYYEDLAIRQTWDEYVDLMNEVYSPGVLPKAVKAGIKKLPQPVQKALAAVAWALRAPIRASDTYAAFRRERALLSLPRSVSYPALQLFGNTWTLGLAGDPAAMARMWNMPEWIRSRNALIEAGTGKVPPWKMDPLLTNNQKMHAALGTRQGKYITEMHQAQLGNVTGDLMTTKLTKKLLGNKWGGRFGLLAGSKKTALNAATFDATMREVVDTSTTMRIMRKEAIPDYRNQTINKLVGWGMDRAEATARWGEFWDSLDGWAFSMDDVIDFFEPDVGKGKAIRLGRDWQETVRKTEKKVDAEVKRVTFAGDETRADLVMKRVFFFHHFASRQSWFYLTQAARHPFLINTYFNVMDELEKATEDWPPYLQNWVKLMGTPYGYALFLNPVALGRSFVTFLDSAHNFDDPDNTVVGQALQLVERYIGINPLAKELSNLTGVFGDDFAPDVLGGWQEANILTTAINYARAYGLLGDDPRPSGNWYEQLMLDTRETISGLNPLRDTPVWATDTQATMDREIRMLIADELERQGMDLDDMDPAEAEALINGIFLDPDSDAYRNAVKRWVKGDVALITTRFFLGMFQPRMRPVNQEGGDLYHGFEWTTKAIINRADPRALALKQQETGWYDLGTEKQVTADKVWQQVVYGLVDTSVVVNGKTYTSREIAGMDEDQRKALANALLQDYGLLDDWQDLKEAQSVFLAQPENKEYNQYREWSKAVRDYPGGIDAYWQEVIKDNPNAERYYHGIMNQQMLPSEREKALTNMYAFYGVTGVQPSVWDPQPESTAGMYGTISDPAGIANQPPQPAEYVEQGAEYKNEVRKAPEVLHDLQVWDTAVKQKQQDLGIDPTIPFNELDGDTRKEIEDSLNEDGVYEPEVSWQVKDYIEWAEQQPAGADTSVDAYFAASDEEYRQGAGERLDEALNDPKPKPLPGPDSRGKVATPKETNPNLWRDILNLMDEHDRSRYPKSGSSGGSNPNSDDYWLFKYL